MLRIEARTDREERICVWRALSELFLDNERTVKDYQLIARSLNESALSVNKIELILWYEVFPVLAINLDTVAGVWNGWSDEWLLNHLSAQLHSGRIKGKRSHFNAIEAEWGEVCRYLNNIRDVS